MTENNRIETETERVAWGLADSLKGRVPVPVRLRLEEEIQRVTHLPAIYGSFHIGPAWQDAAGCITIAAARFAEAVPGAEAWAVAVAAMAAADDIERYKRKGALPDPPAYAALPPDGGRPRVLWDRLRPEEQAQHVRALARASVGRDEIIALAKRIAGAWPGSCGPVTLSWQRDRGRILDWALASSGTPRWANKGVSQAWLTVEPDNRVEAVIRPAQAVMPQWIIDFGSSLTEAAVRRVLAGLGIVHREHTDNERLAEAVVASWQSGAVPAAELSPGPDAEFEAAGRADEDAQAEFSAALSSWDLAVAAEAAAATDGGDVQAARRASSEAHAAIVAAHRRKWEARRRLHAAAAAAKGGA